MQSFRAHGWPQACAGSTRASGSTNSCSGCFTVKTGHGAVRTTRSATFPIMRCARAPRPCVPSTIRSIAWFPAYVTIAAYVGLSLAVQEDIACAVRKATEDLLNAEDKRELSAVAVTVKSNDPAAARSIWFSGPRR